MEKIVRVISLAIFLRIVVGIGSKLQCELSDWWSKCEIFDRVAGIKWCIAGEVDGKKWVRVEDGLDCSCNKVLIFNPQNLLLTFAVEQKEERKRVVSVRRFCEECCWWYSGEWNKCLAARSRITIGSQNCLVISIGSGAYNFLVRNRMSVNVYAFKMAASRFEENIRSYPWWGRGARRGFVLVRSGA